MNDLPFADRNDAARRLGEALEEYRGRDALVLAIPRGAVPIGRIIADALGGELDVVLVRKLGAPENPELAIGAVDERGNVMLNANAQWSGADDAYVLGEARRQSEIMRERRQRYRAGCDAATIAGRTVIVVDDGLATGATMIAALNAVRAQHPARLVCAVPVAARDSLAEVSRHADDTVCLATPSPFHAVGLYYRDFSPVEDDDVVALLEAPKPSSTAPPTRSVRITTQGVEIDGDLVVPEAPRGVVLFVHGSGSSRRSPRNRHVAGVLRRHGMATLLFDLLTTREDADARARFDIRLLSERLEAAVRWVRGEPALKALPIGLFGASTGAAAALVVAAKQADRIAAVVSRGGRPDLAGESVLAQVRSPCLLIVGGADPEVLKLNRVACESMTSWAELIVVPGATHLFEEPGTLEQAAQHAANWFARAFERRAASP